MHVDSSSQVFPSSNCRLQILGLLWLGGAPLSKHKGSMTGMGVGTKTSTSQEFFSVLGREYTLREWFLSASVCIFILTMMRGREGRGGGEDGEVLNWPRGRAGAH